MKRLLSILMVVFSCFILSGCTGVTTSVYVQTSDTIFKFYKEDVLTNQTSFVNDISALSLSENDRLKMALPLEVLNFNSLEEIAVIAAIECYNTAVSPKEIYLDYKDNSVIYVRLYNRKYECTIYEGNNAINQFMFEITKNDANYDILYKKTVQGEQKTCKSFVSYNPEHSNLYIELETYNSEGKSFSTYKDFYTLNNNYTAYRINVVNSTSSSKLMYAFNLYKEIIDFNLKISKVSEVVKRIEEKELSLEEFSQTSLVEKCGYIVSYVSKTSQQPVYTTFGILDDWL